MATITTYGATKIQNAYYKTNKISQNFQYKLNKNTIVVNAFKKCSKSASICTP